MIFLIQLEKNDLIPFPIKDIVEPPAGGSVEKDDDDRETQSLCLVNRHHLDRIRIFRDIDLPVRSPCLFFACAIDKILKLFEPEPSNSLTVSRILAKAASSS